VLLFQSGRSTTVLYSSRQYSHSKSRTNETSGHSTVDGARDDSDDGYDDSSNSSKINKALHACAFTHTHTHKLTVRIRYNYMIYIFA
jgi:hypothetical protein